MRWFPDAFLINGVGIMDDAGIELTTLRYESAYLTIERQHDSSKLKMSFFNSPWHFCMQALLKRNRLFSHASRCHREDR